MSICIDQEELRRRKESKEKVHTTREVFQHLLSLTQDADMRAFLQKKIDILAERDRFAG